jgi:hypothetical protein
VASVGQVTNTSMLFRPNQKALPPGGKSGTMLPPALPSGPSLSRRDLIRKAALRGDGERRRPDPVRWRARHRAPRYSSPNLGFDAVGFRVPGRQTHFTFCGLPLIA